RPRPRTPLRRDVRKPDAGGHHGRGRATEVRLRRLGAEYSGGRPLSPVWYRDRSDAAGRRRRDPFGARRRDRGPGLRRGGCLRRRRLVRRPARRRRVPRCGLWRRNRAARPFGIGAGESATMDLTAADPALRDLLEGFALGALVAQGTLQGDDAGRSFLLKRSGEALLASGNDLAAVRARVGSVEARIAGAGARNAAEASALQIARNGLVAADPYDTASALQAVQTQIETLYALTARLSRLSLTDYLG